MRHPWLAESPEFQRLVTGSRPVHLARVALEVARDAYPDLDIESYLGRIEGFAARVRPRYSPRARVPDVLAQINWVLYVEEELRGNREDYYDARNSYLNEVLDRRLGIPISLAILYRSVAESLGVSMAGVSFPAHFMLRVEDGDRTWFVDAFDSGAVLSPAACAERLAEILQHPVALTDSLTAPCPIEAIVTRMLRNLKAIHLGAADHPSALSVQRRLAALNPHDPDEIRDLAMLCIQADRPGEAIDPLQAYLDAAPPASQAREIGGLLEVIRRRVAEWN